MTFLGTRGRWIRRRDEKECLLVVVMVVVVNKAGLDERGLSQKLCQTMRRKAKE